MVLFYYSPFNHKGPYKINGVPLRRVNQAYVIATSTKVELGNSQVPAKFNDDYFKNKKADKKKKSEFFTEDKKVTIISLLHCKDISFNFLCLGKETITC